MLQFWIKALSWPLQTLSLFLFSLRDNLVAKLLVEDNLIVLVLPVLVYLSPSSCYTQRQAGKTNSLPYGAG